MAGRKRSNLVQKTVYVTRGGKTFQKKVWVKPEVTDKDKQRGLKDILKKILPGKTLPEVRERMNKMANGTEAQKTKVEKVIARAEKKTGLPRQTIEKYFGIKTKKSPIKKKMTQPTEISNNTRGEDKKKRKERSDKGKKGIESAVKKDQPKPKGEIGDRVYLDMAFVPHDERYPDHGGMLNYNGKHVATILSYGYKEGGRYYRLMPEVRKGSKYLPDQKPMEGEDRDILIRKYAARIEISEDLKKEDMAKRKEVEKERAKKIRDSRASKSIKGATPETRVEATEGTFTDSDNYETPKPKPPYEYTPKTVEAKYGQISGQMEDYTSAIHKNIELIPSSAIAGKPRPSYIPEISMEQFQKSQYRLEGTKVGKDKYLVIVDSHADLRAGTKTQKYAIVNKSVLAATQDYYSKKAKIDSVKNIAATVASQELRAKQFVSAEKNKNIVMNEELSIDERYQAVIKELPDNIKNVLSDAGPGYKRTTVEELSVRIDNFNRTNESRKRYGNTEYLPEQFADSYIKDSPERIKKKYKINMIRENRMTYTQMYLHKAVGSVLPEFESRYTSEWDSQRMFLTDMKQRMLDMNLQYEENMTSYSKGEMTSYGRKNTKKDLVPSLGVLVKRQNGDEISPFEIKEIKTALSDVYSVFGNKSSLAKRTGLLVSHSGVRLQHAMKAYGLYTPIHNAIGVTWQQGDTGAGFTMSHEFGHFMDHELAVTISDFSYISEDPNHVASSIANTFRDNMAESQTSTYQNRTCECFARALEQYYSTKKGLHEEYQKTRNISGNHPKQDVFEQKVMPLIDRFFKENDSILKSLRIGVFNV
jgi:hypothetical protein